jgi:hypothetical protein
VIEGLTPTVDEHSIKVEGTGAATITDMTVQLIANREVYEDIYPSDDEEDEEDEDEADSDQEDDVTKAVTAEIAELNVELLAENEKSDSASARLAMLDKYTGTVASKRPDDLEKCLHDYSVERAKAYEDQVTSIARADEIAKKMHVLNKRKNQLGKAALKAKLKFQAEQRKKHAKKQRKLQEAREEKARIKAERVRFWPKKVYKVIVSLDAPSGATPASSRRGSIDSLVKVPLPAEAGPSSDTSKMGEINLSLSYITYSASWSPRYDLSLNSVTSSGVLDYCAELKNTTSETWRDTKVVLSTSQTSYQGLGDTIPVLQPWHVRLIKNGYGNKGSSIGSKAPALYSQYEQDQKVKLRNEIPAQVFAPRNELFGLESHPVSAYQQAPTSYNNNMGPGQAQAYLPQRQQLQMQVLPALSRSSGVEDLMKQTRSMFTTQLPSTTMPNPSPFANLAPAASALANPFGPPDVGASARFRQRRTSQKESASVFGSSSQESGANDGNPGMKKSASIFGSLGGRGGAPPPPAPGAFGGYAADGASAQDDVDYSEDEATINTPDAALLFEESSFSDSGLTTTYDVPTLKTLAPASSTTKHKIARIDFKSVVFSHILIPKLKASAFLKARLRNASKIALLKGPAGLTLDGSFMGQSSIPRCSAGDSFTLPLGVDPTISVSYAKPTVRRSQSGIFSKEDCEVYTRMATVTNTKHNTAVELQVLDQVPISEDERLRIEIVSPRGLRLGGEGVPAGMAAQGGNEGEGDLSPAAKTRTSVYGDNGVKASGTGRDMGKWGLATAMAKKDGEVNWNVKINPLRGCKLVLEYEATYPGGEQVSGIN